ncbi:unnamed protein product [Closterium sp. Naga37s-1]|nr:unnamed protein product [Closterium sp. Naga37s-1]
MVPPPIARAVQQVQGVAQAAAQFAQELVFELRTESQEALRTGLGIPRAVTSIASFGCFAVAAAGTAAITTDFVARLYGARECEGCNGWEGVACTTCRGTGHTRRQALPSSKSSGQSLLVASPHPAVSSSSSAAAASVSLCPTCHGSGVMKCSVCNGDAWKNKITFDRVLDSPLKAWDAYRMAKPVMPSPEAMQDPNRAAFWLLQRPAVEEGVEMSERDKEAVWWEHQWKQRYEGMREAVLQKQPGWQQAQQALIEMDPSAALNDPQLDAAVRTKPLKARRLPKLEGDAEARVAAALEEARKKVEKMTPPPRPKDFGSFQLDWVQESDHCKEPDQSKMKGEAERQQWQAMLQQQREVEEKMLDAAWRDTWQNDKVEESLKKAVSRMKAADEAARRTRAVEESLKKAVEESLKKAVEESLKKAVEESLKKAVSRMKAADEAARRVHVEESLKKAVSRMKAADEAARRRAKVVFSYVDFALPLCLAHPSLQVEESLKKAVSRMKAADEAARRAKAAEAAAAAGGGAAGAAAAAAGGAAGGKGGAASSGGKAAGKKSSGGDKGKGKVRETAESSHSSPHPKS